MPKFINYEFCPNCGGKLRAIKSDDTWIRKQVCTKCLSKFLTRLGDYQGGSSDSVYEVADWPEA